MPIKPQPWHDKARELAQHDPPLAFSEIGRRSGVDVSASMVQNYFKRAGIVKRPEHAKPGRNSWLYGGKR